MRSRDAACREEGMDLFGKSLPFGMREVKIVDGELNRSESMDLLEANGQEFRRRRLAGTLSTIDANQKGFPLEFSGYPFGNSKTGPREMGPLAFRDFHAFKRTFKKGS